MRPAIILCVAAVLLAASSMEEDTQIMVGFGALAGLLIGLLVWIIASALSEHLEGSDA